jgi:hypothetical protein
MDPEKRMADLISVTSRLVDILERENEILRDRRHNDLSDLLDEKETIGRVYQARIMGLQEDPGQLKDVDEDERMKLKELAHKVDGLVAENARMLEAAMYASKRIVEMVADAVRDSTNTSGTYSQKGSTQMPAGKSEARSGAISLDQTL